MPTWPKCAFFFFLFLFDSQTFCNLRLNSLVKENLFKIFTNFDIWENENDGKELGFAAGLYESLRFQTTNVNTY